MQPLARHPSFQWRADDGYQAASIRRFKGLFKGLFVWASCLAPPPITMFDWHMYVSHTPYIGMCKEIKGKLAASEEIAFIGQGQAGSFTVGVMQLLASQRPHNVLYGWNDD